MSTVGVLGAPLARHAGGSRYWRGLITKANPRSPDYMRARFAEAEPGGRLVSPGPGLSAELQGADRVLLLYPDAIGLGWEGIERAVRQAVPAGAAIEVLNGRRRRFALDARTHRALRVRRALERGMVGELVMAPLVVALALVLWPLDALRGRR
jgi:hypothetical protein